jgi:hypothetical protein
LSDGLSSLVKSELACFQSAARDFEPNEMHGVCALLWLRPTITEVDLAASTLPPELVATLVHMLPSRVRSLSLADTDFSKRGKQLDGLRALCAHVRTDACGLRACGIVKQRQPPAAGCGQQRALRDWVVRARRWQRRSTFHATTCPTWLAG